MSPGSCCPARALRDPAPPSVGLWPTSGTKRILSRCWNESHFYKAVGPEIRVGGFLACGAAAEEAPALFDGGVFATERAAVVQSAAAAPRRLFGSGILLLQAKQRGRGRLCRREPD